MKPAAFEYSRAADLDEACALLAAEDDARIIAGGQTLVPLMAMRLARPARLVDISRVPGLAFIRDDGNAVTVGATTRQWVAEHDATVRTRLPLLARALPWVGHAPTRARGTIGGSLANADPAAEIALVAITLGATLSYREGSTTTDVAADAFFAGPMMTVLPAAACLTAVRFPVWRGRVGAGFAEISARKSDFAFASAACQVEIDDSGRCCRLALGVGAVTPTPLRLDSVAQTLTGRRLAAAAVQEAVETALAGIEPMEDLYASAGYRRRAAASLAVRAVMEADASAQARGAHAG